MARRRQRLSSSCTAPAERSPAISSRVMSLRSSTGRSNDASVSVSCGPNAKRASPIGEAFWSSARTVPMAMPLSVRSTFTVILAAAFSAATSASGEEVPPSNTVRLRSPMVLPRPADEFLAATGVDAVGQPGDLAVAGCFQEAIDRGQGLDALDRIRLWRELPQRDARGARRHQCDVAGRLGQRHQRNRAAVVLGIGDQLVGGPDPDVPVRCRAPAVVEHDHQRRLAGGRACLRIPDRAGGGENDQRRSQQPQCGQPPRRPRRRLFAWGDVEQQARRRKLDAARPRRHHPQQPPQHRQADEADQEQRFGEGERQSHHAAGPALMVVVRAPDLLTCMPACRNNSSSAAERSVACVVNSQSSLLVSARIWSRCSASRAV